jgi:soluble lytic murein transglycosylase-like protein
MKRFDPVIAIIYVFTILFLFGLGFTVRDMYERDKRIADTLEAVEPVEIEDVSVLEHVKEIDESVFKSESTIVSYSPPLEEIEEIKGIEEVEITEIKTIIEPASTYFDVPLGDDLQDHIFNVCESYGVDPAIIVAMIYKESTYNADTMGDSGRSYGLMQIQKRWHEARMERLGVTDLLDPYQNVLVGVDYFAELLGYEQGLNWSLMAYNGGINYANKKAAAGEVSGYVKIVTEKAEELRNN